MSLADHDQANAYNAAYLRSYREVARAQGLCRDCSEPAAPRPDGKQGIRCEVHAAKHRASVAAYGHRVRAERRAAKDSHNWHGVPEWNIERCAQCGMTRLLRKTGAYQYRSLGGETWTRAPICRGGKR